MNIDPVAQNFVAHGIDFPLLKNGIRNLLAISYPPLYLIKGFVRKNWPLYSEWKIKCYRHNPHSPSN